MAVRMQITHRRRLLTAAPTALQILPDPREPTVATSDSHVARQGIMTGTLAEWTVVFPMGYGHYGAV